MKLEADRIRGKGTARQPRPFDRVLAFLDVLLARAALDVEGDAALGRPRRVGHDEADTPLKLIRMPLDLGHDAARERPEWGMKSHSRALLEYPGGAGCVSGRVASFILPPLLACSLHSAVVPETGALLS